MQQVRGRRYDTGEPVSISVSNGRIAAVEPVTPKGSIVDWPFVAPALFDLQINGFGGTWFAKPDLTAAEVIATLKPHFAFGITRIFPTLITTSYETFFRGFSAIREACESEPWVEQMVPGCHMEGPYISKEDGPRGAHPLQHVRGCDWSEFCRLNEASGGRIKLLTLAPEAGGAVEFIRKAVAQKITIAIGHTGATPEQVQAAIDAGATLSTHLGNGAHGMIRRHPNYIWEQLADPRLTASIITDGHHLPGSVIRSVIRTKGASRVVITCDAAGLAGCPPGRYRIETGEVEVLPEGKIVVSGQQLLAGSAMETDMCVAHAMDVAGISMREAFDMAGRVPARLVGIDDISLRRGSRADLVVFNYAGKGSRFKFIATIMAGTTQFGSVPDLV